MNKTKHTPTPWEFRNSEQDETGSYIKIWANLPKAGHLIARMNVAGSSGAAMVEAVTNAELIVKSVNNHAALVEAIRKIADAHATAQEIYDEDLCVSIENAVALLATLNSKP